MQLMIRENILINRADITKANQIWDFRETVHKGSHRLESRIASHDPIGVDSISDTGH